LVFVTKNNKNFLKYVCFTYFFAKFAVPKTKGL